VGVVDGVSEAVAVGVSVSVAVAEGLGVSVGVSDAAAVDEGSGVEEGVSVAGGAVGVSAGGSVEVSVAVSICRAGGAPREPCPSVGGAAHPNEAGIPKDTIKTALSADVAPF
jgi:hypothetical protein